jgi:hypothetical protein
MAYYNKHGSGWFNESPRHSLAAQGVKTGRFASLKSGLAKTGSAIATGAKWAGETLKEGVGYGSDEDSKAEYQKVVDGEDLSMPSDVSYSWDAGNDSSPDRTSYSLSVGDEEGLGEGIADNLLGDKEDHSKHQHDVGVSHPHTSEGLSGNILEGDETPAEKINREVDELEWSESGMISTPQENFMSKVEDKLGKIKEWYFSNDSDNLHDEIINLDSDKILLKDKIGMMNGLKQNVLKSRDISFGDKVHLVERIDKQVAPLIRDLNKLDLKVSESKNMLSRLQRENAGITSSKRLSKDEPLLPNPFDLIRDAIAIHAKGKVPKFEGKPMHLSKGKNVDGSDNYLYLPKGVNRGKIKYSSVAEQLEKGDADERAEAYRKFEGRAINDEVRR